MGTRIPLWLLRDLKCRHCKNFLSCGPVYVTPDCGLLCGRCRAIAKPNFRNYVYEELANTFRFPCLNWEKHCPEEGPWNTLKEHEIDCPYSGSCGVMCIDPSVFFSSNRALPNEENLLYIEVPEKCLNLISCKNCGKYLSCEPVHINVVGSNICHRCYLSNGVPPHTLRNLAYEKLANIFRFPCIFRAKGCPIKFKFGRSCWEHEVACHYKDVQIPSTPSTPVDSNYLHPFDNSGYRPSYEGSLASNSSFHKENNPLELPRVSSILRNQAIAEEIKTNELRKMKINEVVYKQNGKRDNKIIPEITELKENTGRPECNCGRKECVCRNSEREKIVDKERGVVPTHTGHVYATLTQNSILFAPPQIQPNKDFSEGIKVTKEFQDKVRRNASNASQNESFRQKKIRDSFLSETGNKIKENYINKVESTYSFESPGLNKQKVKDLGGNNEEYAPIVKEYIQYNPQHNVQRNESFTIGNADIIAELKLRNEQRRKNIEQDQNFNDITVH